MRNLKFSIPTSQLGAEEPSEAEKKRAIMEASLVSIPRPESDSSLYLVKIPNFLAIESTPFDADTYDDESFHEDDKAREHSSMSVDEESVYRVKLRIENTIRWRKNQQGGIESNARWVQWSDGSYSLFLGKECFDVESRPLVQEHAYVYAHHKEDGFLQCHGKLHEKITFRPTSTQSVVHKKLTAAIVEKHQKEKKIKMVVTKKDPERMKMEMENIEADRLRAQRRLESLKRSHGEKYRMDLTESYLEEDSDNEQRTSSEHHHQKSSSITRDQKRPVRRKDEDDDIYDESDESSGQERSP